MLYNASIGRGSTSRLYGTATGQLYETSTPIPGAQSERVRLGVKQGIQHTQTPHHNPGSHRRQATNFKGRVPHNCCFITPSTPMSPWNYFVYFHAMFPGFEPPCSEFLNNTAVLERVSLAQSHTKYTSRSNLSTQIFLPSYTARWVGQHWQISNRTLLQNEKLPTLQYSSTGKSFNRVQPHQVGVLPRG